MDSNQPLLDRIQKKDDDAEILESTSTNIVVKTTLDIGTKVFEEEEEEEEEMILNHSVPVQVVRYLFMIQASIWFCLGVFGIVPAQLLKPVPDVSLALFICAIVTAFILLVTLYFVKKYKDLVLTALILFYLCIYTILFTSSAFFENIAPFQACTILFLQCISILVYSLYVTKKMNVWWTGLIMVLCGSIIWTIGLVAFIAKQDWIMSVILFFVCVLGFPSYCGWFIGTINKNRFHVEELEQVIVGFLTDFFVVPIRWSYAKYVKKEEEPMSFVLAEGTSTVHQNVLQEVSI